MLNQQPEPYWRAHKQVFDGVRLVWYGEAASDEFWGTTWEGRFSSDYFKDADKGELYELTGLFESFLKPSGRYIEAGCGLGYWVAALRARGFDVEGVEYSRTLVDLINRHRPDLPVTEADVLSLKAPDGTYDGYLSFGVVEHRREGPEPFLLEAFRVLKPGGVAFISVPFLSPLRILKGRLGFYNRGAGVEPFFQYGFSESTFVDYLTGVGFLAKIAMPYQVRRCLVEEVPFLFSLNRTGFGARLVRTFARIVPPSIAGHMLMVVAQKPLAQNR
jgi:SAM-dependent methyltransferase